jgi:hypothetical protein
MAMQQLVDDLRAKGFTVERNPVGFHVYSPQCPGTQARPGQTVVWGLPGGGPRDVHLNGERISRNCLRQKLLRLLQS